MYSLNFFSQFLTKIIVNFAQNLFSDILTRVGSLRRSPANGLMVLNRRMV